MSTLKAAAADDVEIYITARVSRMRLLTEDTVNEVIKTFANGTWQYQDFKGAMSL